MLEILKNGIESGMGAEQLVIGLAVFASIQATKKFGFNPKNALWSVVIVGSVLYAVTTEIYGNDLMEKFISVAITVYSKL